MKVLLMLLLSVNGILNISAYKNTNFDYFVFTQQWPPAVCIEARPAHHVCKIPADVNGWVIHGLWPSQNKHSRGPAFCNNTNTFDESKIKPIEDDMRKYWPNLFSDTPEMSFWKYEWKKHGTCALSDTLTKTEFQYFNTGINLFKKHNITSILGQSGIIPNSATTYKANDFCAAVKKALNIVPVVTCIYDRRRKRHNVMQVEICVDKDLKAIDCPSGHYSARVPGGNDTLFYRRNRGGSCSTNCPTSKGIWYFPIPTPKRGDGIIGRR